MESDFDWAGLVLGLIFMSLFIGIPLLIGALRRSKWFWMPAALLLMSAIAVLLSLEPSSGGTEGTVDALGNGIATMFALFLFAYAAIAYVIGSTAFARHQKRERAKREPSLPVATLTRAS